MREVARERDKLRAEVEGVRRGLFKMPVTYGGSDSVLEMVERVQDELARRTNSLNELRAEVVRLNQEWHASEEARIAGIDENERLRAAFHAASPFCRDCDTSLSVDDVLDVEQPGEDGVWLCRKCRYG